MSARRSILVILAVTALSGVWLGWRVARLTESDIIARAGADWAGRGGDPASCTALGEPFPAWVSVRCGSGTGGLVYQADRLGRITALPLADPASALPDEMSR